MVTGSFSLYGIEDLYAYIVSCSSGSTIPTKADGTCKAAVTVDFKKKTDEGLTIFAAPKVIISVLNNSGTALSTETYANRNAVDVTEMINTAGINSYTLNVQLFDGDSLLVSESFLIVRDTDVYSIDCDKGSVIKCTEKGIVSSAVTFSATKNGAMIANPTGYKMVASFDRFQKNLTFDGKTSVTFSSGQAYAGSEIVVWKLIEKATEEVIAINKFSFVFDTPIYKAGKTPWVSTNRYNNGEYIEYEGLIYLWNFPITGNSTLNPKEDVANNPLTTKWKVYEISDLLAARILLADFAKVGQSVFQGNYILSQNGKDANGASSTDYTQFPDNFIPAILFNMVNGDGHLAHKNIYWNEDGTIHLKQDFVYDWINITEYSGHYVDFMKGSFIELSTTSSDTQAYTLWERTNNTSCRIAYKYATRSTVCAILNTIYKFLPNNWADLGEQFKNGGNYIKLKAGVEIRLEYNASKEAWLFDPGQYQVTISLTPDIGEIDSDIIIFNY